MRNFKDEQLLKKIAIAIVENPKSTIKELAEAVGISKATLHRYCGTSENLENMLIERSRQTLDEIILIAKKESSDVLQGLNLLIKIHYENKEFLRFTKGFQLSMDEEYWNRYTESLDEFFLAGQKKGVFKIEFNVSFLTEMFISTICGMVDGEKSGRLASNGLPEIVQNFFLNGAINESYKG